MFGFRPPFKRVSGGRFSVNIPDHLRDFLAQIANELDRVADSDAPHTRRLSPTAYPDDPEKDAGFQILSRSALIDSRREAIATLLATIDDTEVDNPTLTAWMRVINDARLVLGTLLDVSEDQVIDEDSPLSETHSVFDLLGYLLSNIVDALASDI